MKRRTIRERKRAARRVERELGMQRPGGQSDYARKKRWLMRHGVFGFEVREPKPWRTS